MSRRAEYGPGDANGAVVPAANAGDDAVLGVVARSEEDTQAMPGALGLKPMAERAYP